MQVCPLFSILLSRNPICIANICKKSIQFNSYPFNLTQFNSTQFKKERITQLEKEIACIEGYKQKEETTIRRETDGIPQQKRNVHVFEHLQNTTEWWMFFHCNISTLTTRKQTMYPLPRQLLSGLYDSRFKRKGNTCVGGRKSVGGALNHTQDYHSLSICRNK